MGDTTNDLATVEERAEQAHKITYATQEVRNKISEAYAWAREARRCSPQNSELEGKLHVLTDLIDYIRGQINDVDGNVATWVVQGEER